MKLAIHGGKKVRNKPFPAYITTGEEEKEAVLRVMDKGKLSQFLGSWHHDFYGGEQVRHLEEVWAAFFGVKHAISVNSATSALYAAVGAMGTAPGDEVIVSPYSMAASATAPLIYNAVPVFADVDPERGILDVASIASKITPHTRGIIVVDLLGHPYDADPILALAQKHGLYVIEDCAQAPGAKYKGRYAGTLGDIGIFSLNYHKHIHCGEGGILVTDNDELAERLQLIRNHAEAVVEAKGVARLDNLIGFNYRMTEIEAAIGAAQLRKLPGLLEERRKRVQYLEGQLAQFPFLHIPKVQEDCIHSYYVHPLHFKQEVFGHHRDVFLQAVRAELMHYELRETEGVKVTGGLVKPLYLQPMFQQKIAYGNQHYPFSLRPEVDYQKGMCPVVERLYEEVLITHELMLPCLCKEDIDDFVKAIQKVWENKEELK